MSKVYFTSDLHFGHKNILKFAREYRQGSDIEEHDEWLIESINKVVKKNDILFILGDVAFGSAGTPEKAGIGIYNLSKVGRINGTKKLFLGNHDGLGVHNYSKYFDSIEAMKRYKGFWLSHAPIHMQELRGVRNIHGHVHQNTVPDERYINVCVEANIMRNNTPLITYDELNLMR